VCTCDLFCLVPNALAMIEYVHFVIWLLAMFEYVHLVVVIIGYVNF